MERLCACGLPAVILAERVARTGDDPDYGFYEQSWWCQEHAALLVRTTTERYRLVDLTTTPRRARVSGEQEAWDLD